MQPTAREAAEHLDETEIEYEKYPVMLNLMPTAARDALKAA
jgi:hypothetical protein